MIMNRVEWLTGYRWAKEIAAESISLLNLAGGNEKLIELLERGTEQKPHDYAEGVREMIAAVKDAIQGRARRAQP